LIELVIVMAIISIMAVLSWQSLQGAKQASFAENACQITAAAINKTRGYALSGKSAGTGCDGDNYFEVSVGSSVSISGCGWHETIKIPNGASCFGDNIRFSVPFGNFAGGVEITCFSGTSKRKIEVDRYKATCL